MLSRFYRRHSLAVIVAMLASLAVLYPMAESIPPNNNTETWLSDNNEARRVYEEFRFHFGGEELILLGIENERHSDEFVESLCRRLEHLTVVRQVWSPQRLTQLMQSFGLEQAEIDARLSRVSRSVDGKLAGIAILLTDAGLKDRAETMTEVQGVLHYCGLDERDLKMTGAPVIIAELNRLGGQDANRNYFLVTMGICLCVLWYTFRQFAPAILILLETVWAFQLTLAVVYLVGGEMNFILDSLPVMVMVFTMAVAIHYLHHLTAQLQTDDPVANGLRSVWWPCFLAVTTTAIGLASLGISDIPPVRQFGLATAGGTIAAFIAGLGITPAILTIYPPIHVRRSSLEKGFRRLAAQLYVSRGRTTIGICALVAWCSLGLVWVKAEFEPLNFFPSDSKVLQDTRSLQKSMANTDSVEVIIDFGTREVTDAAKIEVIRDFEREIKRIDRVPLVLSAATFLPDPLPQGVSPELENIRKQATGSDFIADGGHLWRLSARIQPDARVTQHDLCVIIGQRAQALTARHDVSVTTTGIAPLIERAQRAIFDGFWKSVLTAFVLITVIMIISLRSPVAGLVAMIPNVTPILLVFGSLGWMRISTDIGMMMTGSIALGIAVDGTFHFLTVYCRLFKETRNSVYATRKALQQSGPPIIQATFIMALGMLALGMSNFGPTLRFGILMSVSLAVALIGDLLLLPCLLFLRPKLGQLRSRSVEVLKSPPVEKPVLQESPRAPHMDIDPAGGRKKAARPTDAAGADESVL